MTALISLSSLRKIAPSNIVFASSLSDDSESRRKLLVKGSLNSVLKKMKTQTKSFKLDGTIFWVRK